MFERFLAMWISSVAAGFSLFISVGSYVTRNDFLAREASDRNFAELQSLADSYARSAAALTPWIWYPLVVAIICGVGFAFALHRDLTANPYV
jgi:hypothetical protein